MGLQKTISTAIGYDAEYSEIRRMYLDYTRQIARLVFDLYKDEAAYLAGNIPVKSINLELQGDDFVAFEDALKAKTAIKNEVMKVGGFFEGATDTD